MAYCGSLRKLYAGCASTGLAAIINEGFETAHSHKAVDLILWDEFPSCDREVFEAAHRALNDLNWKVVVTMGDMRSSGVKWR